MFLRRRYPKILKPVPIGIVLAVATKLDGDLLVYLRQIRIVMLVIIKPQEAIKRRVPSPSAQKVGATPNSESKKMCLQGPKSVEYRVCGVIYGNLQYF